MKKKSVKFRDLRVSMLKKIFDIEKKYTEKL